MLMDCILTFQVAHLKDSEAGLGGGVAVATRM